MSAERDRHALIEQSVARYRQLLEQQLPDDNATLEQIEEAIEKIGNTLLPDLQQKVTNQRAQKPRDNQIVCACGGIARYRALATRTLVTRQGLLRWTRPTYYCSACGKGSAPLDTSLALDRGETTLGVRMWVALLAAHLGFAHAAHVLEQLRGLSLSPATVERIAVQVGTGLRQEQQAEAQLHHTDHLPDKQTACPRRLYVGADGLMTPLRDVWKRDGSLGTLTCRYGECKSGVIYETDVDHTGRDTRVRTHTYVATLAGVETFELLLGARAHRCGHHAAKEVVVLGDGAPWIWNVFGRQFPGAIQILDFYHACEHLAKVAEAMHDHDTEASRTWQRRQQARLKTDRIAEVVADITAWSPASEAHREVQRIETAYFADNAERMRYGTYLQKGYHIGSGVVEATCKHVVAQRLDQAGMHWRTENAEAIVALRANYLSTQPTDLKPFLGMAA